MIPLLYIAGYGRSGSTILEAMLGTDPRVFPTGEMSRFWEMVQDPSILCSCGEPVQSCPLWGRVLQRVLPDSPPPGSLRKLMRRVEGSRTKTGRPSTDDLRTYERITRRLFSALTEQLDSLVRVLVDSSKTAYGHCNRPGMLHRLFPESEVRVLHLVRDVRGVAFSMRKGLNRNLERNGKGGWNLLNFFRAIIGWTYANMRAASLKKTLPRGRYLLVRYEDFVLSAPAVLDRVRDFLGLEPPDGLSDPVFLQGRFERHQLAGNRNRFDATVAIRPDFRWKKELKPLEKALALGLGWPLMKRFDYLGGF
ncbi:MAG TPA: sulfotransferase [Syntrophobacteraceae bacterium]|nr:sulfotransferase [Syntrophobacteraceae bacterium]